MDDACKKDINTINAVNRITFFKLGPLVNASLLQKTFPNATIIDWDIEKDDAPSNWNQLLWKSFGCRDDSPIILPPPTTSTKIYTPTKALTTPTTHLISTTTLSSTTQTTTRFSSITTTAHSSTATTTRHSSKPPVALIVGLSVFVFLLLVAILVGVICFCSYQKKKRKQLIDNMVSDARTKSDNERNERRNEVEDLWEIDTGNVEVFANKKLGCGASANVFLGKLTGDAGIKKVYPDLLALRSFCNCDVAVKILPAYATELDRNDFKQEINFMKNLKYHQHIICLLGYTEQKIVLEYCAAGNLMRFLKRNKDTFNTGIRNALQLKDLISFAWQVANGMEHFASLSLVHRDLAARNILLTSDLVCKISDFGLSRTNNVQFYTSKKRLPVRWMPPEALKMSEFNMKTDIWSYAILLFEIFTVGDFPYSELDNEDILSFIEGGNRLEQPEHASDDIYNIMTSCWNAVPNDRPNFTQICQKLIPQLELFNINYNYVNPVEAVVEETNELAVFDDYFIDDCSV